MNRAFVPQLICAMLLAFASTSRAEEPAGGQGLPRSRPEAQGVDPVALTEFVATLDEQIDTMHSFMIVRHGQVVAEGWWAPQSASEPHVLWSLSKSFTSTAVGLVIEEGKLSLEDHVIDFFPDDLPEQVPDHLKQMTVRDLLTMSAGHADEAKLTPDNHWAEAFLAHPVPHEPGTHFRYNTPATYMCSAIVQKVTGQTVLEYLRPRLFEPLGIESPRWDTSPQGESIGGYGLFLRTEDIAKFGQLYLQRGRWNGKQIIPETWVEQATSKQVENGSNPNSDWNQGYGFQFWRCRHGAFRGDGMAGQFCIVIPEQDVVVAMTANCRDMQAELNVVWDKLLPALEPEAIPNDDAALSQLQAAIDALGRE